MTLRPYLYAGAALLFQSLVACSAAQDDAPAPAQTEREGTEAPSIPKVSADERLIVAFGDSLYAGYQLGRNEGFAPQLERALEAEGIASRVVNAGVSGDTSAAGRQRLNFTLEGLPRKPDLVLVGLGGNDMLRGIDPAQTRSNLTAILDELKRREIPAMLTGMLAAPNLGPDYRARFEAIYPELAEEYDVPLDPFFLDGVLGVSGMMLGDQIHPSPDGVENIADRIAPEVEAALGR